MNEEKIKIEATIIIEILGKPKDHLEKTLRNLIDQLGRENGVEIMDKTIHDARLLEQVSDPKKEEKIKEALKDKNNIVVTNEIFTSFAEIYAKFDNLKDLLMISFNYMPSNIEVTKPENFILKKEDMGEILTTINTRLHKYDEIAKRLSIDKALLENEIKKILESGKKSDKKI